MVYLFMEQEMQGNSLLFIIAGHDTTATTLSFLVYELALASEIQERVVAEITEVLPNKVWNSARTWREIYPWLLTLHKVNPAMVPKHVSPN